MLKNLFFEKKTKFKRKIIVMITEFQQYIKIQGRFIYTKGYTPNLKRKDNLLKSFHQLSIEIIKNQSEKKNKNQ